MNKVNNLLLVAIASSVLVACSSAQKATEVSATRAPVAPYLKMDCKELATEAASLSREATAIAGQVDAAYSDDKTKEVVAWILFAPAALFMKGNQEQTAKLAAIKGQTEAVQEAQKINKCVN